MAEGGREIFREKLIEDVYKVRVKIITEEEQMFILPVEPV